MNPRRRITLLAVGLLSFVLLPGLSRDAHAIAIDNDVLIEWQQKAFENFDPTVTNGNFVVNNAADLSALEIEIAITHSELLGGFTLLLDVVNPVTSTPGDYAEILVGGLPLKLTFAAGYDNNGFAIPGAPNPAADLDFGGEPPRDQDGNIIGPIPVKSVNRTLQLSDLQNSQQIFTPDPNDPNLGGTWSGPSTTTVLQSLLASGPLGFSLNGSFTGNRAVPADLACQDTPPVCEKFPGTASITVTGGQAFPPPPTNTVPEPSSLALLLLGITGVAGLRRRRS